MTSPSIFKTGKDKTFFLNDVSASVDFAFISTDVDSVKLFQYLKKKKN